MGVVSTRAWSSQSERVFLFLWRLEGRTWRREGLEPWRVPFPWDESPDSSVADQVPSDHRCAVSAVSLARRTESQCLRLHSLAAQAPVDDKNLSVFPMIRRNT